MVKTNYGFTYLILCDISPNLTDFSSDVRDGGDRCYHSNIKTCYSRHMLTIKGNFKRKAMFDVNQSTLISSLTKKLSVARK